MNTEAQNYHVAKEILNQLGGNKFVVMTGSSNFIAGKNSLTMKIKKNISGTNYLRITLTADDLYKMEFINVRGVNITTKKIIDGVYNDQLQKFFTMVTGFYTKLF